MTCAAFSPECQPPLEWHHAVKQQRIRREFRYGALRNLPDAAWPRWIPMDRYDPITTTDEYGVTLDDILGDTRNRIWLCQFHHERLTNGRLKVELPESVWEFAAEFGFTAALENDARRAA